MREIPQTRGQPQRGQDATCHGPNATGGAGPRLRDARIPLTLVRDRIENGKGIMPPNLVSGQQEADVLAYVATLLESKNAG